MKSFLFTVCLEVYSFHLNLDDFVLILMNLWKEGRDDWNSWKFVDNDDWKCWQIRNSSQFTNVQNVLIKSSKKTRLKRLSVLDREIRNFYETFIELFFYSPSAQMFIITNVQGSKMFKSLDVHVSKCPCIQMSMCPSKCSWGLMFMGPNVHKFKCPSIQYKCSLVLLSNVHGSKCPWVRMSISSNVHGFKI